MVRSSWVDKDGVRKGLARCGKSCRLRWINYRKPGIKRGDYSKEEEDLIVKLHHELGNKWSVIAAKLPGRTDNEIKNYWHTHLKKGVKRQDSSSKSSLKNQQQQNNYVSSENMMVKNSQEVSLASDIHILESSSSSSSSSASKCWNDPRIITVNCSASSSSRSAAYYDTDQQQQQLQNCQDDMFSGLLLSSGMISSTSDERADSFGGFGKSFWTEPFLVDTSCCNQIDDYHNFTPLDEDASFIFTEDI
ncbi:hypothetical protein BUALT_Bualt05G0057800 [Buddleja alternifolia]|uniref:Uncharacterized protein n=1 Tax=Buddleja alternifolia TaxID=168488 RepID=A0AAV6XST7_9LAMI|nr:hypothetical protein BUALT_Bualt05G0057800 [Buddleja alternifolia]